MAKVRIVPKTIDPYGTTEVGAQLQALIDKTPDGYTIKFPDYATYWCDKGLKVYDRHGLDFEGNGTRIKRVTPKPYPDSPPKIHDDNYKANRTCSNWDVQRGSSLTWRYFSNSGANVHAGSRDDAYVVDLEAQHGMNFNGVTDVELDHVDCDHLYGDTLYFGRDFSAPGKVGGGKLCSKFYVHDGRYVGTGRQGISFTGAEDILYTRNLLANVRRTAIDIEPGSTVQRITISYCIFGRHRLTLLSSGGLATAPVGLITFDHNCIHGSPAMMTLTHGDKDHLRGPYIITNNWGDTPFGTPSGTLISIRYAVSAEVSGNHLVLQAGRNMYGVKGPAASNINVHDNTFVNGKEYQEIN